MASPGTCPRGHELAENAVYCTVCWIRVEPVDPEVIAARKRRQRRIWIPLMGAGAVALGVVVGGSLGIGSDGGTDTQSAVVAAEAPPSAPAPVEASTPAPSPSTAGTVVAAPLAATVAESTTRTLEACVPEAAASVLLKGRSSTDEPWVEAPADITIGEQGTCPAGEVTVTVASQSDAQRWRLVVRDGSGDRIAKITLDAPAG